MRGVQKAPAPVNVAPPDQPRRSLLQAERGLQSELKNSDLDQKKLARAHFDQLHKPAVRASLLSEQRGLCAYCERRVTEPSDRALRGGRSAPRIAHWTPIVHAPSLALAWENLVLSCASPESCDIAQRDRSLGFPCPSQIPFEEVLTYTRDGWMIVPESPPHLAPQEVTALREAAGRPPSPPCDRPSHGSLGLNTPALRAARRAALDGVREGLEKHAKTRTLSLAERQAFATRLLSQSPLPPHVSVQVAWLLRQLAGRLSG